MQTEPIEEPTEEPTGEPIEEAIDSNKPIESKKRKAVGDNAVKSKDESGLFPAEQLRDALISTGKKIAKNDVANSKNRLDKEQREHLHKLHYQIGAELEKHKNDESHESIYFVNYHRRMISELPYQRLVKPVFIMDSENPNDQIVKSFRIDLEKPYFRELKDKLPEELLGQIGKLFQRNSAVNVDTLAIERTSPKMPRQNWKPDPSGFFGEEDWTDLQKLTRMLWSIFSGKITISKQSKLRAHVAKLLIAAILPGKYNLEAKPNTDDAKAMVKYLWEHVGVMSLYNGETILTDDGKVLSADDKEPVKHVIVYRMGVSKKFKPRVDVIAPGQEKRELMLLEETPKRWLVEMTKQLLLGNEEEEGYEGFVPKIVRNYVDKDSISNVYEFLKEMRTSEPQLGELEVGSGIKIPLYGKSEWGNPCFNMGAGAEDVVKLLFNRNTEDRAFIDELQAKLSNADIEYWAGVQNVPISIKEAPKAFKDAVQNALGGILKAKFSSDVAGLAIVRRAVAASVPPAAGVAASADEAAAQGAGATPVDHSIHAKLDEQAKVMKNIEAMLSKLTRQGGENIDNATETGHDNDEVMEAEDDGLD